MVNCPKLTVKSSRGLSKELSLSFFTRRIYHFRSHEESCIFNGTYSMVTGSTGGIAEGLKNCFSLCTLKDFLLYMVFSKKIKEVRFLGSIMIHPPMHYFIYDLSPYSILSIIIQDNKTIM